MKIGEAVGVAIATFGLLVLSGLSVSSVNAGGTFTVRNCQGPSPYQTIQSAVNAAEASGGGNVNVCPGTYPEQVTITSQLNLQGIQSGTMDAAIITPPNSGVVANAPDLNSGSSTNTVAAQLYVKNVTHGNVNVSNLVVDGSGTNGNGLNSCNTDLVGVLFQDSSGSIEGVTTRNQILGSAPLMPALGGCQDGLGIWVQSDSAKANTHVEVESCSVHDFQKNAMEVDGAGTQMQIEGNSVVGAGPTPIIAQNGIQVSNQAQAQVKNNLVIDLDYSQTSTFASGILVDGSSNVQVQQNNVGNVQEAIVFATDPTFGGPADHGQAQQNFISATSSFGDAIDMCSNNDQANNNNIFQANGESAIHFDAACGSGNNNHANGNTITEANVGILKDTGTTGNNADGNNFFGVVTTEVDPPSSVRLPSPHQ